MYSSIAFSSSVFAFLVLPCLSRAYDWKSFQIFSSSVRLVFFLVLSLVMVSSILGMCCIDIKAYGYPYNGKYYIENGISMYHERKKVSGSG